MAATRGGNEALVEDLLNAGQGYPLPRGTRRRSTWAAVASCAHPFYRCMERGREDGRTDSKGCSPLQLAVERGHVPTDSACSVGCRWKREFARGRSALAVAWRGECLDTVTTLLRHGASVDACSSEPGHTSCSTPPFAIISYATLLWAMLERIKRRRENRSRRSSILEWTLK